MFGSNPELGSILDLGVLGVVFGLIFWVDKVWVLVCWVFGGGGVGSGEG